MAEADVRKLLAEKKLREVVSDRVRGLSVEIGEVRETLEHASAIVEAIASDL